METSLCTILAEWLHQLLGGGENTGCDSLFNGNKWREERWQSAFNAIAKAVSQGSLNVADEQVVGPIGQVFVLLTDGPEPRPERVCFINDGGQWRMLASLGDFTACPWDYNTERQHAMIDLNCSYMKWAARRSGWSTEQMLGLETLLKLAK